MPAGENLEWVEPRSRSEWRSWLAEHHSTSPGIWLVVHKKGSDEPGVRYEEAVEEALCFGWIDSTVYRLDDKRVRQLLTPRKPRSTWSDSNKARVERLIAEGCMTDAGLAVIEVAKRNGSWESLEVAQSLDVPKDLAAALEARPGAREHFDAFPESSRKSLLWWLSSAKRAETRDARIDKIARMAQQGLRAQFDREPETDTR